MSVRLKDIAEAAQVSIALVSNYVNGKATARMSDVTRSRIDRALRELDYRPNPVARMLRTGEKDRIVGIITAGLKNEVNTQNVLALHQYFLEKDYNVLIYHTKNELGLLRKGYQEMLRRGCAGVIVHSQNWCLDDYPLPQVIQASDRKKAWAHPSVFCDYRPGVEALLEYLSSLGHRRLICLAYRTMNTARKDVFEERFGKENVESVSEPEDMTPEYAGELLKRHPGCTAAFCCNDLLALAFKNALEQLGMKIPQDFSVAGFDNILASQLCGLTTVDQMIARRALSAGNALLNMIEKRSDPVEHCISTELVIRNSCSHIKQ